MGLRLGLLALSLASAPLSVGSWAIAQTVAHADISVADAVAATTIAAAETQVAEQRAADDVIRTLREAVTQLERRVANGDATIGQLTEARERLIEELEEKDADYAAFAEQFRAFITPIADTAEGRELLAQRDVGNLAAVRALLIELAERRNEDIQLQANRAQAANFRAVATLALDDRARGEATTADVIALFEAALALDDSTQSDWLDLSRLYDDAGRLPDAEAAARRALDLAQTEIQRGNALVVLADMVWERGDAETAETLYSEALEIHRGRMAADPQSASRRRALAGALLNMENFLRVQARHLEADALLSDAIEMRRQLARDQPDSASVQLDLATALRRPNQLGILESRARLNEALEILDRLLADAPEIIERQRGIMEVHRRLGLNFRQSGDLAISQPHFERAVEIAQRVVAQDPRSQRSNMDLSNALDGLGNLQDIQGQLSDAQRTFEMVLEIDRRLAEINPASLDLQYNVAMSLSRLGEVAESRERGGPARRLYQEAVDIQRMVVARDPSDGQQRRLSILLTDLGRIQYRTRMPRQALATFEEVLGIDLRLLAHEPENRTLLSAIGSNYHWIGQAHKYLGDDESALASLRESLRTYRLLTESDPQNAGWRRRVGANLYYLAEIDGSGVSWREVVEHFAGLERDGLDVSAYASGIRRAQRRAAREQR